MNFIRALRRLNLLTVKSIYFNFRYLGFKQAIKFPILISNQVQFRKLKGNLIIEGGISTGMIQIGFGDIGIFDRKRSRSIWEVSGTIIFKGKARIGHGSKISVAEKGCLVVGKNFIISAESSIVAWKKIEIGENCLISWDVLIMDTDLHNIRNAKNEIINLPAPVHIDSNVWIGCRSLILKGVYIPKNCVVAANTVVTKKLVGENKIFGGHPVNILKDEIYWEHDKTI